MMQNMYKIFLTIAMIALTILAVSIITYCVHKIKKGADINSK
jgi:hypothetical protein